MHASALLDLAELWRSSGDKGDAAVAARVLRNGVLPPLRAMPAALCGVDPTDAPRAARVLGDLVLFPCDDGEGDAHEAHVLFTEV